MDEKKLSAILSGREALNQLAIVNSYLSQARGWGVVDILGGSTFTSVMKHSKINKANTAAIYAQRSLSRFISYVQDIQLNIDLHVDIGTLLLLVDILGDSTLFDIVTQVRINRARENVGIAMRTIQAIISQLQQ